MSALPHTFIWSVLDYNLHVLKEKRVAALDGMEKSIYRRAFGRCGGFGQGFLDGNE